MRTHTVPRTSLRDDCTRRTSTGRIISRDLVTLRFMLPRSAHTHTHTAQRHTLYHNEHVYSRIIIYSLVFLYDSAIVYTRRVISRRIIHVYHERISKNVCTFFMSPLLDKADQLIRFSRLLIRPPTKISSVDTTLQKNALYKTYNRSPLL